MPMTTTVGERERERRKGEKLRVALIYLGLKSLTKISIGFFIDNQSRQHIIDGVTENKFDIIDDSVGHLRISEFFQIHQ
jgi:hypothetical protein